MSEWGQLQTLVFETSDGKRYEVKGYSMMVCGNEKCYTLYKINDRIFTNDREGMRKKELWNYLKEHFKPVEFVI